MKFTVLNTADVTLGTIDIEEDVYLDDDALIAVLAGAGYVDRDEVLEITEDDDHVEIFESESGVHLVSLVPVSIQ